MTKLLKKEQRSLIAQLCSLEVPTSKSSISPDLQKVLENHAKVFDTPKGLPPIRDHDHAIHLIPGSVPPNIRPYRYPYVQKSEIERMIAEMLEAGYHPPSITSSLRQNLKVQAVEDHIEHQQEVLQLLKDNLNLAQNRMKQQEDQHHIKRSSEAVTGSRTREVRSISECLSMWKNFPVEDSTWEDDNVIQKHQEIIKR